MGNRIYGCDDCLAVCPWNRFAHAAREPKLRARDDLAAPRARRTRRTRRRRASARCSSGSPIKRIGRNRFVRNVLIAIGNSGDRALVPAAARLCTDADPVVAEAAAWALARLQPETEVADGTDRDGQPGHHRDR